MIRGIRWRGFGPWLAALVLLLATGSTAADPDRGILWQIRDGDRHVGYLFGTVHSDQPRVLDLPAPVRRAIDRSRVHAFELDLQALDPEAISQLMRNEGGPRLDDTLPPGLWRRAENAARKRGLPATAAAAMEPWALAIVVALPPTDPRRVLDHALQRSARARGERVVGLESAKEQLSIFDELDLSQQVDMLRQAVEQFETGEAQRLYDALIEAWLARDLARIAELAERHPALPDPGDNHALMDRLLRQRNERMARRMEPLLAGGDAFIAVGAMHLVDEDGLVRMLERRGYDLRALF